MGKVIGQPQAPRSPALTNVSIEMAGGGQIEFAVFPIQPISPAVAHPVFGPSQTTLRQARVPVSGDLWGERIDEVVECHKTGVGEDVLLALFAYETSQNNVWLHVIVMCCCHLKEMRG
jgi:hypothetical protein